MFPSGSEGFDVSQLMQQAQRMQEQFQQNLSDAEVTGTAGGGLVSATVDGTGELVSLDIDPSVVDPEDVETLADLIVAAVRDGQSQVQRLMAEQMGSLGSMLGALGAGDAMGDLPADRSDDSNETTPERE
ncbi:MAG: YbaB/EbfC family nucleoid-associated protein [Actinomycetota bacterium]